MLLPAQGAGRGGGIRPVTIVTDLEQLLSLLPAKEIIALDGIDGSGKTTLAERIRAEKHADIIHADKWANDKKGLVGYLSNIDYSSLASAISSTYNGLKVIDGILILDILQQTNVNHTIHIFCDNAEVHLYGKKHSYELQDDPMRTEVYSGYLTRHSLPDSADIIYRWERKG